MTRYLCICQYGHSRSAALVRILHERGQEAICVGWGTSPSEWMAPLQELADVICTMEPTADNYVVGYEHKVVKMHVGPDIWSNPYHPELLDLCRDLVKENLEL